MVMKKKKSGQGTLEYILILVVILAALLVAAQGVRDAVGNKLFPAATNAVNKAASVMVNSFN